MNDTKTTYTIHHPRGKIRTVYAEHAEAHARDGIRVTARTETTA